MSREAACWLGEHNSTAGYLMKVPKGVLKTMESIVVSSSMVLILSEIEDFVGSFGTMLLGPKLNGGLVSEFLRVESLLFCLKCFFLSGRACDGAERLGQQWDDLFFNSGTRLSLSFLKIGGLVICRDEDSSS
ncbi:hypothetical protein Tco_0442456 [Tanacetum coccineum]